MTDVRVDEVYVEALAATAAKARVDEVYLEALTRATAAARVDEFYLEVLTDPVLPVPLADSVSFSDAFTATPVVTIQVNLADSANAGDQLTLTAVIPLADQASSDDRITQGVSYRSVGDTAAVDDQITVNAAAKLDDAAAADDQLAVVQPTAVDDSAAISDTLDVALRIGLTDAAATSDGLAAGVRIAMPDSVAAADGLAVARYYLLPDAARITETFTVTQTKHLTDAAAARDNLTVTLTVALGDDALTTGDRLATGLLVSLTDTITVDNELIAANPFLKPGGPTLTAALEELAGASDVALNYLSIDGTLYATVDVLDGVTAVTARTDPASVTLDPIAGGSQVDLGYRASFAVGLDAINGASAVVFADRPDLAQSFSANAVSFGLIARAGLLAVTAPPAVAAVQRAQPSIVLTAAAPIIVHGRPIVPRSLVSITNQSKAQFGRKHIHWMPKPDPTDDPGGSSGRRIWTSRWSVRSLPNPGDYGANFYWLGEPSSADGTANIQAGARQWAADSDSGPAWQSMFPFKPSVVTLNHYLEGGVVVNHPKGVNLNSHFIEHMWMDWGGAHKQPFTWVIAACVTNWNAGQRHYLLDSGRDPDKVGFPRLSSYDVNTPRTIKDPEDYRTSLMIERSQVLMKTRPTPGGLIRERTNAAMHPRMYVGVFNGSDSHVGVYGPHMERLRRGAVSTGPAFRHRYYVLGRANGLMSQRHAGSLLVFEIRYFNRALDSSELKEQYHQIAPTYNFHKYVGS